MSQKKLKRSKGANKPSKKKIPDIDVQGGEGYYGIVEKIMGGNIVSVKLNDNTTKMAKIPGKFFKKVWMRAGTKVLLNLDLEIVHVIRDTDLKSSEADRMLRNAGNDGDNLFQYNSDSESESDDNDDETPIKKTDNIGKIKELMSKKENDKLRDANRKGGRVIRDEDIIQKELGEVKNSNIQNTDDININDI